MSAIKTFEKKMRLAKKMKQNRPMPNWARLTKGKKAAYGNTKRRHWRKTKLRI